MKLMKYSLIGLFLLTIDVLSQDQNFYIFLSFGQSNMEGQGIIAEHDKTVDARFQVMEAVTCSNLRRTMGKWYTAVPPLCRCYTGLSPTDYFGRTMVDSLPSNIKIGVVNVSVAGCKIELFDKDNYQSYASTAASWMKNIIAEYGGNPYGRLVEIAMLAQKDGIIKGILLHQGESNTGDNQWPSKVKKIYNNLIADLELDPAKVPLLAGEVVHADQGGVCASMNSIIAKLPQTIPNSYVISSSGCKDTTDNLHFSSEGYRELGKRYATKMLSLLKKSLTSIQSHGSEIGTDYKLEQNYPNPFNPVTKIKYSIPSFVETSYPEKSGQVMTSLRLYDILGKEVAVLVNENQSPGNHEIMFDGSNLASGIYFYKLLSGQYAQTRKFVLIK
jgi:hypothetical protein